MTLLILGFPRSNSNQHTVLPLQVPGDFRTRIDWMGTRMSRYHLLFSTAIQAAYRCTGTWHMAIGLPGKRDVIKSPEPCFLSLPWVLGMKLKQVKHESVTVQYGSFKQDRMNFETSSQRPAASPIKLNRIAVGSALPCCTVQYSVLKYSTFPQTIW
jgi:hypothetical protein